MAEESEAPAKIEKEKIPVSPAPSRSQANQQNRAPDIDAQLVPEDAGAIPPISAKPPPEKDVYSRRRSDVSWVPVEMPSADDWTSEETRSEAPEGQPRFIHRWGAETIVALIALAQICIPIWGDGHKRVQENHSPALLSAYATPLARENPAPNLPGTGAEIPEDAGGAITAALDHLNAALEDIPEQSPEQILKQISGPDQDCMLAWTNKDVPSLVFGKEPIQPNSLARTLDACADAVAHLASLRGQ